jgi:hypothetical protein
MTTQIEKRVFKSSMPYMQMIADDGTKILFIRKTFITDNPRLISYLDKQIEQGVTEVYIDPEECVYNPDIHDPIAALRHKIREELLAEQAAVRSDGLKDLGSIVIGRLNPASTSDIASVAAGAGKS